MAKWKKLHPKAVIPEYKSEGAACMDLVCTEIEQIDEDKVIVKFGFSTSIYPGWKFLITPRSSFTHTGWVMANSPGVIDSDYRGEWMIRFDAIPVDYISPIRYDDGTRNISGLQYPPFPYKVGDRVAQCSFEQAIKFSFKEVEELDKTERGEGGFGSTNLIPGNIDTFSGEFTKRE